jgi:protein-disulfide isomerase
MPTSNIPRPTKAERREAARAEARALREAQARREKRNRLILVGSLVAVIALIAVAVAVIIGQGSRSALDGVAAPAGANDAGGIVVGAEGVGAASEGAPEVAVYSDFMCPFCGQFELTNGPMLEELRTGGEATVVYHPVAFLDRFSNGTNFSTRAAEATAVVADAAPEQFTAFYAALFENQPAENTDGLSDEQMAEIAVGVGVPEDIAATFSGDRFDAWVTAASDQATRDLPRPATPTILIDGTVFEGDWTDPENLRAEITG